MMTPALKLDLTSRLIDIGTRKNQRLGLENLGMITADFSKMDKKKSKLQNFSQ